ncbi:MAG: polysaccharide deacetylase [Bryobacterales bacterium]|nr:polysaccharide deacetylase [Bryobacterales bacterium]
MLGEAVAGSVSGAAALMAYAVRGPSSSLLGPSVYRGPGIRRSLALTFDDGPSEGTPEILAVLREHGVSATFFQCGANIRRLPEIARAVAEGGHEIGNHTDTHPKLCFRSPADIEKEFSRAQETIQDELGRSPSLMRAPFGVRWFGFRQAQEHLNLLGVMWTVIAKDWKLDAPEVAARLLRGARNGGILCLHDGRELEIRPETHQTAEALRIALPALLEQGFRFETVSQILCPKN